MAFEIIYVCNSINNKNVRQGELEILRKYDDKLFFEFGENEMNVKKRFYNNLETMNKDFNALLKIKEKEEKEQEVVKEEKKVLLSEEKKETNEVKSDFKSEIKKPYRKANRKSLI